VLVSTYFFDFNANNFSNPLYIKNIILPHWLKERKNDAAP
jgi:hypothetical protein